MLCLIYQKELERQKLASSEIFFKIEEIIAI